MGIVRLAVRLLLLVVFCAALAAVVLAALIAAAAWTLLRVAAPDPGSRG